MAEKSAEQIESRNKKYLDELSSNIGKYFSYLSTMARFHKYEVSDLTSFAIEAPAMFTAVASKELWEKHFRRKINVNARGVTLIKDGKSTVYYDVSETERATPNSIEVKLWKYDEQAHKKFLALNVETVILEETQATAKIFLDAMQRSVLTKSAENVSLPENNLLLKEIGIIQVASEPEKNQRRKKNQSPRPFS